MASGKELKALITLAGKIDPSLQAAMMKASKMNTKLVRDTKKSTGLLAKTMEIAKGVFIGNLAARGVEKATGALVSMGTEGMKLASDLTEVQNVVDTTFGSGSNQIEEWSKKALNSFGLAELQAKQFNGTMGAMLKSSGVASKDLLIMSQNLSGLAGDFASFYNLDPEQSFEKIRSGISGETEPLKQLGINMSVANLEAFALSKGIKTSYSKMNQASQTLLRYNYLMSVSKDAQGDFAKTQGSYANQQRLFSVTLSQITTKIASKSLPVFTKLYEIGNKALGNIDAEKLGGQIAEKLGAAFEFAGKYLPTFIQNMQKIPPIVSGIYDKISSVTSMLLDKWPLIEPIVWGIVAAIGAYELATWGLVAAQKAGLIITALTKAWETAAILLALYREGATIAAVAQLALNLAMEANPIGLVITGIGLLVAAGVALYKNWDTITGALSRAWEWFKNLITGMPDFVLALAGPLAPLLLLIKHFDKVKEVVGGAINAVKNFFGFGGDDSGSPASGGSTLVAGNVKKYASGGFADRPSIFGEAGLEAAIPIKYRNPRSISILNQTARAIGAGSADNSPVQFIFAPNISGGNSAEMMQLMRMGFEEFKAVIDQYFEMKAREAFG